MAQLVAVVSGLVLAGMLGMYVFGRRESRAFPAGVCAEIASMPERRKNQHVVDLQLRDGRVVRKVWVAWGRYPAVIGGGTVFRRYLPSDVVRALPHEGK